MVQSQVCSNFHICFHVNGLFICFHGIWNEKCLGIVHMGICAMSINRHWMETFNHKREKRPEEMMVSGIQLN